MKDDFDDIPMSHGKRVARILLVSTPDYNASIAFDDIAQAEAAYDELLSLIGGLHGMEVDHIGGKTYFRTEHIRMLSLREPDRSLVH